MFTIYIQNFKNANGTVNTTLTQMFSIPSVNKFPIDKPTVKGSEDAADSFSFKMEANSPYYDALILFKTRIRVDYDGDTIFYGHVMSINTSTLFQTKQVNCSGAYAFMNDTYYEGVPDTHRSKITVSEYLTKIINNHNAMAPDKTINRGNITNPLTVETEKYEPSSWSQTSSLIGNLKNEFGGHFRVRYYNGVCYLDWYKYFLRDLGDGNRPSVTIRKNILEFNSNSEVDNMFTRVIPYGATTTNSSTVYLDGYQYTDKNGVQHTFSGKAFPVSLIKSLYTDNELTDEFHSASDYTDPEGSYGVIYKTISFPSARTKEKLWNETKKWVKDSYFGLATSFSIKAFDMHLQDTTIPKILVGDRVDINYYIYENGSVVLKTKKYVCKSIQYDLFNPENNTYSFGVPSDILDRASRKYSKQQSDNAGGNKTGGGGGGDNNKKDLTFDDIATMIWKTLDNDYGLTPARDSFVENGPHSGTVYCYDVDEIEGLLPAHIGPSPQSVIQNYANTHREACIQATIVGKITLSGKTTKWVCHSTDPRGGVFAFVDDGLNNGLPKKITHWYQKNSDGKTYEYTAPSTHTMSDSKTAVTTAIQKVIFTAHEQAKLELSGQTDDPSGPITPIANFRLDADGNPIVGVSDGSSGPTPAETIVMRGGSGQASINMEAANNSITIDAANKAFEITNTPSGSTPKKIIIIRSNDNDGPKFEMADDTTNNYPKTVNISARLATVEVKHPTNNDNTVKMDGKNSNINVQSGVNSIVASAVSNALQVGRTVNGTVQPLVKVGESNDGPSIALHNDTSNNFAKMVGITARTSTIDLNTSSGVNTIEVSGSSAKINVGNTTGTRTVEVDGANQKVYVGKNDSSAWRCAINELVTYTDSSGVEHTNVPGFIVGEDMKIDTIPSFKTKLAVVDTLIAGKVNASSIAADLAYIRKINSSTISANTYVSTHTLSATNAYISNTVNAEHFTISSEGSSNNFDLTRCYSGLLITTGTGADAGKIFFNFSRADGTAVDPVPSFNMADTAFYQNAVSAARTTGWDAARSNIVSSLPTSTNQRSTVDGSAWTLSIPKSGYNSGTDSYNVIGEVADYTIPQVGQTVKVVNVKIGNYVAYRREIKLQTKSITPTSSEQTVTPDSGYVGFKSVTVESDSNGRTAGWNAARTVIVNSLPTSSNQRTAVDGSGWNLAVPKTGYNSGSTSYTVIGDVADYQPSGTSTSIKVVNVKIGDYVAYRREIKLEDKGTITPTTSNQSITPSSGKVGIKSITVAGDSNLVASKIQDGVTIFGVTGTYTNASGLASARTTGWNAARTITASTIPSSNVSAPNTNYTISVPKTGYNSGSDPYSISVANNAVSYSYSGATFMCLNISLGSYIVYRKTIDNLNAGNIKSGTTILGVTGTYTGSGTISDITGTAIPDSQSTDSANPCTITASGTNVSSLSRKIFVKFGSWNTSGTNVGKIAANVYLGSNGSDADTRISRQWITAPTPSTPYSSGTKKGTTLATLSQSSVTQGYIVFTVAGVNYNIKFT